MPLYQRTVYDTDNLYDWTSIQTTYDGDNGDIVVATRSTFDAGYEVFGTYENGILIEEYYSQPFDAFGFNYRIISYDTNGQIIEQVTGYPGALAVTERFEDGVRTETVFRDWATGEDAQDWTTITYTYDADGNITQRQTVNDDMTASASQYIPGIRELQVDIDQSKNWDSIERLFDADGDLIQRIVNYDQGIMRQEFYTDGVQSRVVQTDNAGDADGGIKAWSSIDVTYGADGKMVERLTDYDNGTAKVETFEAGVRVSTVQTDAGDAKTWDTISTKYEDGIRTERKVEQDNGDVFLTLYTDGARTSVLQLDGNDSHSWLLRVIEFPEGGGRDVTAYETAADIPTDVLEYFPDLAPPKTEMVLDFNDDVRINDGDEVLDGAFVTDVSQGQYDIQGILMPYEYGEASGDTDLEAFNSWGSTISFSKADGAQFDFDSLSLANSSKADVQNIPEGNWANEVTVNGYDDGVLLYTLAIGLTFEHVTHDVNFEGIDQIEFVASGGEITNSHVENAGWFSMDDLTFLV